jgi:hypothetical protein
MNPAYDSYNYPYVGPHSEYESSVGHELWYFIWDNVRFGPYDSQREAQDNFESLQDRKEADSCSEAYRHE